MIFSKNYAEWSVSSEASIRCALEKLNKKSEENA